MKLIHKSANFIVHKFIFKWFKKKNINSNIINNKMCNDIKPIKNILMQIIKIFFVIIN